MMVGNSELDYHSTHNPKNANEKEVASDWTVNDIESCGNLHSLTIKKGFKTDGASIPRIFWRLIGHPWEDGVDAAAIPHDWLYASHYFDRKTSDLIFKDLLKRGGVSKWRRETMYYALRSFGWVAWNSHGEKDQEQAMVYGVINTQLMEG